VVVEEAVDEAVVGDAHTQGSGTRPLDDDGPVCLGEGEDPDGAADSTLALPAVDAGAQGADVRPPCVAPARRVRVLGGVRAG